MTADNLRSAAIISRAFETPWLGFVQGLGIVSVVAERELFGHVFQFEVVTAGGKREAIDCREVGDPTNVSVFREKPEPPIDLFGGDRPVAS